MICENISVNEQGHLCFAGKDTVSLAKTYGTPLYLLDTDRVRANCRRYLSSMRQSFGKDALPLYAGKALCIKEMYRILAEEGMGIDVVSGGEIYTAKEANFPLERAYFHGNNKTDADIAYAMDCGVGCFVCDNEEELLEIERQAQARSLRQKILLRLAPGIDPHTHRAISTGSVDSKFGVAIETGQAKDLLILALQQPHIEVAGYHCHIGSQIFEADPFLEAGRILLAFAVSMRTELGFTAKELNLGGGMGVCYTEGQPKMDYSACIEAVAKAMRTQAEQADYPFPSIRMEPGRSIVADAGMSLYTVGTVKIIPHLKNYVSVDGGMPDNPRYALYQSPYTFELADRMGEEKNFVCSVAGRCCESGDLLGEGVALPLPVRGNLLAMCTTGAYQYAMSSNYNRLPRPAILALSQGKERIVVRRETYADLVRNEC